MRTSRKRLWEIIDQNSIITGTELTLSAGAASSFYFDCKPTTLDGEGLNLIADEFLKEIGAFPESPTAIGGLTLGADFIVAAVIMRAHQIGCATNKGLIVRKEPKKHGTRNHIENELESGTAVVVVDDVITTGISTAAACDKFLDAGYRIVGIVALIDREAGGVGSLEEKYGCPVRALFKRSDFPALWVASRG